MSTQPPPPDPQSGQIGPPPDWQQQQQFQQWQQQQAQQPTAKKKKRIFLWVFLAVQALFIIWIIAGISSASGNPDDCGGLSREACNDAEAVGTGIGVALIVGIWIAVDFLLAVIYGVYRLASRRG